MTARTVLKPTEEPNWYRDVRQYIKWERSPRKHRASVPLLRPTRPAQSRSALRSISRLFLSLLLLIYRIPESAYFSLLLVQSSQNMRVVLMVSTFHSDARQGCIDAPSPWPCIKSSRAVCSNLRSCSMAFDTSSSHCKPSLPCKTLKPAGGFSPCPAGENFQ